MCDKNHYNHKTGNLMCHFRRQENCLRISALEQRSDVNDAEFSDLLVF